GNDERSGLDAVGNDAVLRAFQLAHAFYADRGCACAFDASSHFVEKIGEVGDFGFAGAILEDGLAFRQSCGHQEIFGAGDGDLVEDDLCAFQAVGFGFDVTVLLRDLGAELLESLDVEIDGARSNRAAAGERDAGASAASNEGAEDEGGGAHGLDQFVRRFGGGKIFALNGSAVLGAAVAEFDVGAHRGEEIARGLNVADLRNVFEDDRL